MLPLNYKISEVLTVMEDGTVLANLTYLFPQGGSGDSLSNVDIGSIAGYVQEPSNRLAFVGGKLHQGWDLVTQHGKVPLPGYRLVPQA